MLSMVAGMRSPTYNLQILWAVVELVPVPMMHAFIYMEGTTQVLLHDVTVFAYLSTIHHDPTIACLNPTTLS